MKSMVYGAISRVLLAGAVLAMTPALAAPAMAAGAAGLRTGGACFWPGGEVCRQERGAGGGGSGAV